MAMGRWSMDSGQGATTEHSQSLVLVIQSRTSDEYQISWAAYFALLKLNSTLGVHSESDTAI